MSEVIGPGCSFCRDLYRRVREVVAERGMDADIVHVTDLKTVLRYIPFTPVLKVSGRIVHRGKRLPGKDRLWDLIRSGAGPDETRSEEVPTNGA
jgi:hypothetical protein